MKILVTGGAGFIGSNVVDTLIGRRIGFHLSIFLEEGLIKTIK